MGKKGKKRREREQEVTEPPQITEYLEIFAKGRWTKLQEFKGDTAALKALVAYRDKDASAHLRITNDAFKVVLDVPPTGQS
jgi:hypothetical protein